MNKLARLAGILGCISILAAAGCASNTGVAPFSGAQSNPQVQGAALTGPDWVSDHGVIYHRPHYMGTRWMARPSVQPDIQLTYSGGPVLTKPRIHFIFWGYKSAGDPNKLSSLLEAYAKSIGGSAYNNIYTQYYGPSGNITNPANQFSGAMFDNTNPIPSQPTDSQIAAEAVYFVTIHGYDPNGSYVVATAHGHSTSGFGTQFCAYHSATVYNSHLISYTDLPYMPDAGSSCGSNIISPPSDETGVDEGVTIVEGHEYGESVTDPNPPSGWYNNQYGEIGDICAWTNIQNDPYGTHTYTAQPMFSNASSSCVHHYP
jgi:hypothetical protein